MTGTSLQTIHHVGNNVAFVLGHTTNNHYLHVVNTSRSFPHSWLITGFVTRVTWRVPLVEQELLTLPEHLISPPFLVGFVLLGFCFMCVCFVDRWLSLCSFSFCHCIICPSSTYGFWLPPFGIFILFLLTVAHCW